MRTNRINKFCGAGVSAALVLLSQSTVLALTPTQLQVTSSDFSANTHWSNVTVFNPTHKTVVAYTLSVASLDAAGRVMEEVTVGFDLLCQSGSPCQNDQDQIKPEQLTFRGVAVMDEAVGVDVTAAGAIYDDRMFDGDPLNTAGIFEMRAKLAKDLTLAQQ